MHFPSDPIISEVVKSSWLLMMILMAAAAHADSDSDADAESADDELIKQIYSFSIIKLNEVKCVNAEMRVCGF